MCTLMGSFWTKYLMFELKKYRELCLIALTIDAKFEGKLTYAFKNDMKNFATFHRLKNSDIILESKIVGLNQNNNLKQPHWPDALRKLYVTWK